MLGYLPDRLLMFDFPDRLLLFKFNLPDRTHPKILRKNSKSTKHRKFFYKITDFIKFIKYVTDF